MPDGSFLNTAREIVAPAPRRATRYELQLLAGMVHGRELDVRELGVTEAWVSYRKAQRKVRDGLADKYDLTPEFTRSRVRLAIASLRALKGKIVAEYGRHLPAIRRGLGAA